MNTVDCARCLVGCARVLVHSFQTADSTPTFFSDGNDFSNTRDTKLNEKHVSVAGSDNRPNCIIYYRESGLGVKMGCWVGTNFTTIIWGGGKP